MNNPVALALLLLSLLYRSEGQDADKEGTSGGEMKSRGEVLAEETNAELVKTWSSPAVCQNEGGTTCLSCRSVGMCKGGVMTEVQCRGLYSYCDVRTGTCTSESRQCKGRQKAFDCPAKGYFPDPQSCRTLHVCEGEPMTSYTFTCSSLQVYNHAEKKCTRPGLRARCTSFSCFGKNGRFTAYPSDRSLYTLCNDASGTALFKCPEGQEFYESKQKCSPSCTSQDNMPDTDDSTCKKYYRCVKSSSSIEPVPAECPGQRVFDPTQLKCVAKTSSFQCPHETKPETTTASNKDEKEDVIGETQESFFRESESVKSSAILGSAYDKVKQQVPSESDHIELPGGNSKRSTPTMPSKNSLENPTSNGNADSVVSLLSRNGPTEKSQSTSKIELGETDLKMHTISSSPSNKQSLGATETPVQSILSGQTLASSSVETTTKLEHSSGLSLSATNINDHNKPMTTPSYFKIDMVTPTEHSLPNSDSNNQISTQSGLAPVVSMSAATTKTEPVQKFDTKNNAFSSTEHNLNDRNKQKQDANAENIALKTTSA